MSNKKKILFVHQNFPGQYKHLANHFANDANFEVHTLSIKKFTDERMINHHYKLNAASREGVNQFAAEFEAKMIRAHSSILKVIELNKSGFAPDIIIGHPGWGETIFLKEIWPDAKLISYVEYYYNTRNSDIDFDLNLLKQIKSDVSAFLDFTRLKLVARNAYFTQAYIQSDFLVCPTEFQKDLLPDIFKSRVKVIHDGINTSVLKPDATASLMVNGRRFTSSDKIISYISRSLDPYRGFHIFIETIPQILKDHPDANIFIVGNPDTPGYGAALEEGRFKEFFYSKIENKIDKERVFFLGVVDYEIFKKILQITSVHLYLTFPFVLSWSMLEAMSCGSLVLGSNTGPVSEVIKHNENGILVDFFDTKSIANNINSILKNKDNYKSIKDNARETILKKYDLKSVCLPQHLDLINEVIK